MLNPLYGPEGAAYTYAKQKGASPDMIVELDRGLEQLSKAVKTSLGKDTASVPGSGAAGGVAYGLKCFLNAAYIGGTGFLLKLSQFEKRIKEHHIDIIITGEGKIDSQTQYGKFIHGLIQEAQRYGIPVIAVCGKLDLDATGLQALGLRAAEAIYDPTHSVSYSFENAPQLVAEKTCKLLETLYG